MKIAQIVCAYPPYSGGIGNSAYQFHQLLAEKYQIKTFNPKKNKPFLRYGHGAFWPQLFSKLKKFDLIFLHYPFFGTAEIVWLFKIFHKKTPLIIQYHMDVKNFSLITKILSIPSCLIRSCLLKKADKIICSSFDYISQSQIKKYYQKKPDKFIEIPFGINTQEFRPDSNIKKKYNNILFVGGLDKAHYFKGLEVLFKALSNIKEEYHLNIIGDGNLKEKYKKQSKDLNIKVSFLGKVSKEDLIKAYQKSDIFVLPSINSNEAFGLVILEAMASGLSIIASKLPGVRQVFNNNEQGLQVKAGDIEELRTAIQKMLSNRELQEKMRSSSRKLVNEKYSKEIINQKIKSIFAKYESLSN